MQAIKDNAVYTVDENNKDEYRKRGFDIYDDKGKLIAYGVGKTVSIEKYVALQAELETVKAELKALKKTKKKED